MIPRGIHLRAIDAADGARLAALFSGLGPDSRHQRFLGPKPYLTASELRWLTDVDQRSHVAIAAVEGATDRIVAEGRYASWADAPHRADLAVTVADDFQGRRIGTTLAWALAERARVHGVEVLTASTMAENHRARALLRRLGFRAIEWSGPTLDLELPLVAARQRSDRRRAPRDPARPGPGRGRPRRSPDHGTIT